MVSGVVFLVIAMGLLILVDSRRELSYGDFGPWELNPESIWAQGTAGGWNPQQTLNTPDSQNWEELVKQSWSNAVSQTYRTPKAPSNTWLPTNRHNHLMPSNSLGKSEKNHYILIAKKPLDSKRILISYKKLVLPETTLTKKNRYDLRNFYTPVRRYPFERHGVPLKKYVAANQSRI